MPYATLIKAGIVAALLLGWGGYTWFLRSSLIAARSDIARLNTENTKLKGDLENAGVRSQVEDTVRTLPDPVGELRRRYSRPE